MENYESLNLVVAICDQVLLDIDVRDVVIPALDGYMGFLPNHIPLISALSFGEVSYTEQAGPQGVLFVREGFVEVQPNKVTILANIAELPEDIDVERAETKRAKVERELQEAKTEEEANRLLHGLERANARLAVAYKSKHPS